MAFDPDAYLASKKPAFDPDAYLASKSAAAPESAAPESGVSAGDIALGVGKIGAGLGIGAAVGLPKMVWEANKASADFLAHPIESIKSIPKKAGDFFTGLSNVLPTPSEVPGQYDPEAYQKLQRLKSAGKSAGKYAVENPFATSEFVGEFLSPGAWLKGAGLVGSLGKAATATEQGLNLGQTGERLAKTGERMSAEAQAEKDALDAKRTNAVKDDLQQRREMNARKAEMERRTSEAARRVQEAQDALQAKRQQGLGPLRERLTTSMEEAKDAERIHMEQAEAAERAALERVEREHAEATAASEALASEQMKALPQSTIMRLRGVVERFQRTLRSDIAGKESALPTADQTVARMQSGASDLNTRVRSSIMDAFKAALEKKRNSPAFKRYAARFEELTNGGELWGQSKPGIELLEDLKKRVRVVEGQEESNISRLERKASQNTIDALEFKPEPTQVEGPKGGVSFEQGKPVPAAIEVVDKELRELRWQQYRYAENGNMAASNRLRYLADKIEKSIKGFVGEEYFPNAMYAADAADYNLYGSKLGKALAGTKSVKYTKIADPLTKLEDVAKTAFDGTDNIRRYRELLKNDNLFHEHSMQHIANELHGLDSEKVMEWLGKNRWVDQIEMPEIRSTVLRQAESLAAQERNTSMMKKVAAETEKLLAENKQQLENAVKEIEKSQEIALRDAEKNRLSQERAAKAERIKQEARAKLRPDQARRAARAEFKTEAERLEASLSADKEAVRQAQQAKADALREKRGLNREATQAKGERQLSREERSIEQRAASERISQKKKVAESIERLVIGQNPKTASRYFRSVKGRLVSSGAMTEAEASELESLLSEQSSRAASAARNRKIRNWILKWTAAGLGASGAYHLGKEFL